MHEMKSRVREKALKPCQNQGVVHVGAHCPMHQCPQGYKAGHGYSKWFCSFKIFRYLKIDVSIEVWRMLQSLGQSLAAAY